MNTTKKNTSATISTNVSKKVSTWIEARISLQESFTMDELYSKFPNENRSNMYTYVYSRMSKTNWSTTDMFVPTSRQTSATNITVVSSKTPKASVASSSSSTSFFGTSRESVNGGKSVVNVPISEKMVTSMGLKPGVAYGYKVDNRKRVITIDRSNTSHFNTRFSVWYNGRGLIPTGSTATAVTYTIKVV